MAARFSCIQSWRCLQAARMCYIPASTPHALTCHSPVRHAASSHRYFSRSQNLYALEKSELLRKVKEIREVLNAPMVDVKNALEETNGDIDAAKKILYTKGLESLEKKQDRVAAQGSVVVRTEGNRGAMIELNCQTDFVAANESFVNVSKHIVERIHKEHSDRDAISTVDLEWLKGQPSTNKEETIGDAVANLNYSTGEKVVLSGACTVHVEEGAVGGYSHQGRIGALVGVSIRGGNLQKEETEKFVRNLAIHIAGFYPAVIGKLPEAKAAESVADAETGESLDKEGVGEVLDSSLMAQPFTISGSKGDVGSYIRKLEKQSGAAIKVSSFVRWELGGKRTEQRE